MRRPPSVLYRRSLLVSLARPRPFRSRSLREKRERKGQSCSCLLISSDASLITRVPAVVRPWTMLLLNTCVSAPRNKGKHVRGKEMSGATKEIGAPENRIGEFQRNFVLTPRGTMISNPILGPVVTAHE